MSALRSVLSPAKWNMEAGIFGGLEAGDGTGDVVIKTAITVRWLFHPVEHVTKYLPYLSEY
jgi:hypothetical protein